VFGINDQSGNGVRLRAIGKCGRDASIQIDLGDRDCTAAKILIIVALTLGLVTLMTWRSRLAKRSITQLYGGWLQFHLNPAIESAWARCPYVCGDAGVEREFSHMR
jgi:hypothetical protein